MSQFSSSQKRLRILTDAEIDELYARPTLTEKERIWLFELNKIEQKIVTADLSMATKVDAIIRLGYFKRKQQFFHFELHEVQEDFHYIQQRYFSPDLLDKKRIGREAKLKNQNWVLQITGYRLYSQTEHLKILMKKSRELCRLSVDPVFIFRELISMLTQHKITRLGYSTLQKIISQALMFEQERISQLLNEHLASEDRKRLFNLFEKEENFYAITLLKQQPKNFKPTAIRQEVTYFEQYQPLYQIAKKVLPLLEISKNGMAYYASLVEHYTVQSLNRINADHTCLWLLCFVHHRYQRMLDNLATMFIYTANQYKDKVDKQASVLYLLNSLTPEEQNKTIAKLIRIYIDKNIKGNQTFKNIRKMVFDIVPADCIDKMANELDNNEHKKIYQSQFTWQAVDEFADTYRPLLHLFIKVLYLEGDQHKSLQKAYQFLLKTLKNTQPLSKISADQFPIQFINAKILPFIYDESNKKIITDRYEYECYRQLATYLNGRSLFLKDSLNYQSLTAMLIEEWSKNKAAIIKQADKPLLSQPFSQFIEEKAKPLDDKIDLINKGIQNGENPYVKLKSKKDGTLIWTLPYTKRSLDLNNPFYEKLPTISIVRIMQFVNSRTQFMKEFTHIKPYYSKSKLDETMIYACLIANGTNLGVIKMASLCDLNLEGLNLIEKNYIRLATLRAANDVISNAIAKLTIFKHWNLHPDLLHASLDGQKFMTEWQNLLSRYSQKDFGFDMGVVAYSLIANHVPINTAIIGANEHESRFLFDLIYNNTSEIQPDIFSTDTEGSNQLNFLLLHLIGRIFAPRYRSLNSKMDSIISFSDPKKYKDGIIKPYKKINEKLILKEEDNIKHILASLLMGETKQSSIVTKLSSQHFSSQTKQAIWEMNAVLMTDHLLNYMGDVTFRQSIQGALNRGEAYHQLRRYIEKVNGRHFRGLNEMQIMVWNECARLLANSLIYYNAVFLDQLKEQSDRQGETKKSHFITQLSPVAWTHANFQGKYEFLVDQEEIDVENWLKNITITEEEF